MPKEQRSHEPNELIHQQYVIVLWNDDINTFDHVILCLMKYCQHSSEQAHQCALFVHYKGKCNIKRGDKEELIKIWNSLTSSNLITTMELV